MSSNTDHTMEYFEEYRQKITKLDQLRKEEGLAREQLDTVRRSQRKLIDELDSMRKIITIMVDNGIDPVEAKLRTEPEERKNSFWTDDVVLSHGTIDTLQSATAYNNMGMTSPNGAYSSAGITGYGSVSAGTITAAPTVYSILGAGATGAARTTYTTTGSAGANGGIGYKTLRV